MVMLVLVMVVAVAVVVMLTTVIPLSNHCDIEVTQL
jgi:hypothetical protein